MISPPVSRSASRARFVALAGVLLGATLGIGTLAAAPLFPNPVYPVGSNPYDMARADFDGDGHADLVVANATNNYYNVEPGDLSLLRGTGDGSFAGPTLIALSRHPSDVFTGDFNGDGHADLAVNYYGAAAYLLGHGDGTFGLETPFGGATTTPQVQAGNFNGDGRDDLLLSETVSGSTVARPLFGNADGTFTAGPIMDSGALGLMTVTEVNGDGRDDVLMIAGVFGPCSTPQTNTIRVYMNQGNGTFVQTGGLATGYWNESLVAGDIDGDGHADLFITAAAYQNCSGYGGGLIYYGNGDGTFSLAKPFDLQIYTHALVTADLNGDGKMDYIDTNGSAITTHLGNGDRTFTDLPPIFTARNGDWLRLGKYDGDGVPDLAVLDNWSEAVFVFAGNPDGSFGPPRIPALAAIAPSQATTADLNGDGLLDIVATDQATGDVVVVPGAGNGAFGAETRYPVGIGPNGIATADFNHDGHPDVAVTVWNWTTYPPDVYPNGDLKILLGNGDGTLAAPVSYPSGMNPIAMTVDDLDADGSPDVIVVNWGDGYLTFGDLSLYFGQGDGTLQNEMRVAVNVHTDPIYDTTTPVSVATGDLNHDGHRDIVVGIRGTWNSPAPGEVELLTGDGQRGFAPPASLLTVSSAAGVAVGDLNQDGLEDIAVADPEVQLPYDPGGIIVLFAHQDGSFTPSALLPCGPGPYDVRIDDFNADGLPDLAVSNNGGYLALLPGLGGGAFGPHIDFGLVGSPLSLIKGDFDGNGTPDFLVFSQGGVFLMRNAGASPPPPLKIDAHAFVGGGGGNRSATVTWKTNGEYDLTGFNVVVFANNGTRSNLNAAPIGCAECTTGAGHSYTFVIPKHQNVREVFIEAVHVGGRTELFGPVPLAKGKLQSPTGRYPVAPVP